MSNRNKKWSIQTTVYRDFQSALVSNGYYIIQHLQSLFTLKE